MKRTFILKMPARSHSVLLALLVIFLFGQSIEGIADNPPTKAEELLESARSAYSEENYQEAFKKFEALADRGDPRGQSALASMYYKGEGVARDINSALKWALKSAEQGWPQAQYQVAHIYRAEEKVRDLGKSIEYYKAAAESGHAKAQYSLALIYEKGIGVSPDAEKAIQYYEESSKQGYAQAMYNQGVMYEIGSSVERNLKEAYRWFYLAGEYGYEKGRERVEQYNEGLNSEQMEYLEQTAEKWREQNIE